MSIQIPLSIFNHKEKEQLLKNLTVKSQGSIDEKKKDYNKDITLYGFEIINDNILLPFSYCHNFLSSKLKKHDFDMKYPNSHKTYPKCNEYKFPFELRYLHKEIKPESIEILNRTHSLLLSLYTGGGKTFFALHLAKKMRLITAVSVKGIKLIEQWKDSIKKFCPGATYQVITGKSKIKKVDFYIFNMTNIKKRKLTDFLHVGLLICDEVHTLCTPDNMNTLFYFQPKYLLGLSATPYRTDKLSDLLHLYFGIEIIERKLNRPFNSYCCYTDFIPKIEHNSQGGLDWNSVIRNTCEEEVIIDLIVDIARFFITRNILILTKRVEIEGQVIYDKLSEYNEKVDIFTGKKLEFDENTRILVATSSKAGTGFDFAKLDLLIVASDMKENFIQYLGRIFREEDTFPMVIDIVHGKFRPFYNHFIERKNIYINSGAEVKNIFDHFPELVKWFEFYKPIRL